MPAIAQPKKPSFWRTEDPELNAEGLPIKGGMWPHQRQWWNMPNFIRMMVTGYGGGKTLSLVKRAISMSLLNSPIPYALVSPTYAMARDTIGETLYELLNGKMAWRDRFYWEHQKSKNMFVINDGGRIGRIRVYSGEDPLKLKGPNLCGAGIDEPFIQDEGVFTQMIARIRHPKAKRLELSLGGCVTLDSIVLTPEGFVPIGEMNPGAGAKEYVELETPVFGEEGFQQATQFFNNGVDDVMRLTLTKGFELRCTPDHPVMVMGPDLEPVYKRVGNRRTKYAHLDQLEPTDKVAISRGMEVWGNQSPEGMTEDDAYGLGVWVAEGSVYRTRLTITCGDQTVLSFFRDRGLFGEQFINPSKREDQVRLHSQQMVDKFEALGMPTVKAPQKWLPKWVMGGGEREHVLHFLAGMYDGDGHVCTDGLSGIGYTTSSEVMARQLQVLLTNLGVCTDVIQTDLPPTKKVRVWSRRWQIIALGQNVAKLAELLPLRIPRKRDALDLYRRDYRDSDCIPYVGATILRLWSSRKKERWRNREVNDPPGYRICESIRQGGGDNVSYRNVRLFCRLWRDNEAAVPDEIDKLEALVSSNYYWASVRSIEYEGRLPTADFVVPKTHSVMTGGLLGLNTPEQ